MKGCDIGNTGSPLDSPQCFGAGSLRSNDEADNCRVAPSVKEDVGLLDPLAADNQHTLGGILDALPGCNPIQAGPQLAIKQSGCGATEILIGQPVIRAPLPASTNSARSASTKTTSSPSILNKATSTKGSPSQTPSPVSGVKLPSGWTSAGCFSDQVNPRSLGTQPEWWGLPITSSRCIEHCDAMGEIIAGTENGGQCFCGNKLTNSVATPHKCNLPCVGNAKETCGGIGTLSIFKKSGGSKARRAYRRHLAAHGVTAAS